MSFNEALKFLESKNILDISWYPFTGEIPILMFDLGKIHPQLHARDKDDETYRCYHKHIQKILASEQPFFYTDTDFDYIITLFGNLELKCGDELLLEINNKKI